MFAVRGFYCRQAARYVHSRRRSAERHVRFRYETLDGLPLWTDVRTNHTPLRTATIRHGHHGQTPGVRWTFAIDGARRWARGTLLPRHAGAGDRSGGRSNHLASLRAARSLAHRWTDEIAAIETDSPEFNRLLRRSAGDLRALLTPCAAGEVAAAGIPWFVAPFGRDSCITALESLMLTPRFAVGALRALAAYQGTEVNPARDEEPGKILHEIRVGELSRAGVVPFSTYYGSVDSTPLFVMLFAQTMRWLDADALYDDLLPHVRRALAWCDTWGDADGDGYIEFGRHAPNGVANQGWKDSHDSLHHPDGSEVLRPDRPRGGAGVCLCREGVAGGHRRAAGRLALGGAVAGRGGGARRAIRARFLAAGGGVLCLRARRREAAGAYGSSRMPGISSIAIWCAATRRRSWRNVFFDRICSLGGVSVRSRPMLSGIDPDSYHNGSVWPHDNALIALGMRRAGQARAATAVAEQVIAAGFAQPLCRIPELYAGYARTSRRQHRCPIPSVAPRKHGRRRARSPSSRR